MRMPRAPPKCAPRRHAPGTEMPRARLTPCCAVLADQKVHDFKDTYDVLAEKSKRLQQIAGVRASAHSLTRCLPRAPPPGRGL